MLEVTCDFGKNILKLIIYSFNLKLFDFHVADFDETESEMEYSSMLRNDIEISDELNQITESLDFQKFVATFHLKIIHKVLVDHYNFQKGGHVKSSFSNKRPVELFDSRKGNIAENNVIRFQNRPCDVDIFKMKAFYVKLSPLFCRQDRLSPKFRL